MESIEVALPLPLNKTFSYLPCENIIPETIIGKRVKVPLGTRNVIGYALSVQKLQDDSLKLKSISSVIDSEPIISKENLELAEYISKNYICSLGEALASIIPASMKPPKRQSEKLKVESGMKDQEAVNSTFHFPLSTFTLSEHQNIATSKINNAIKSDISQSFLLHGVTASGKTEVYLNCIQKALELGKSAIMLIPEISLTAQFVEVVSKRFPNLAGVWHSGITNIEKYKLWKKAESGEIKIMLGARSAVFAPFKNLGIIIIDEEHEHTYKQEQKPSYDAREIALWRAHYHSAPLVLGSATPSLESFKAASDKKIELLELPERIDKKELPNVTVLSLKDRPFSGTLLTDETISAISKTLAKKEQVVVFLNRRGYSPSIVCKKCGSVYQCPNCSISMVYHKAANNLKCHYCGQTKKLPIVCPVCGSKESAAFGSGTQKIEEELKKMFHKAKIFRLDGDTANVKENYENAYKGVKNEEYDILIGTQMIAKGFDFPKVTLVCVINADTSLYLQDFKSSERTFQLITQVAGRCGRGKQAGTVIVQTKHPDHYAIENAKKHDFLSFYKEETKYRQKLFYPPFCDVAKIAVRNKTEAKAEADSQKLFIFLQGAAKSSEIPVKLLGPAPAHIAKLHNTYRMHIIIKGQREDILKLVEFVSAFKESSGTQISIEIMPSDLI